MKTNQWKTALTIALAATCSAMALNSHGAAGYKRADKTGAGIAEFSEEILNGKTSIDATMKALGDVAATANSDPRKAFEQFSKEVPRLESAAAAIRKRALKMKEQGNEYFDKWEADLANVKNPEIRKLALDRKAKLEQAFASIRKYAEPLRQQFDPWMSDLKDLQKYLSNDLTIAGVDAAKTLFTRATSQGHEVQKSMDALIAELNTIGATITPAKK
jgi:hypothetical protein